MFQNLLNLCQVELLWSQNLPSLLAHLHQAIHRILDLHHLQIDHLPHLQIDHLPHLQIDHLPHLQIDHLRHLQTDHLSHLQTDHLLHYHLTLDQLEQAKLVVQTLTHQFEFLLEQNQLRFYLIQDFKKFKFLNHLKH